MPILKDPKQEQFCQNIVIKLMKQAEAYEAAGYSARGNSADQLAYRMRKRPYIEARIRELGEQGITQAREDFQGDIKALHVEATQRLQQLMNSENAGVSLGACKEVLARTVPIIKQSQNITVRIDSKEADRRKALLASKRAISVPMPANTSVSIDK